MELLTLQELKHNLRQAEKIIRRHHLSTTEMALITGISASTLNRYRDLSGAGAQIQPRLLPIARAVQALDLDLHTLVFGTPYREPASQPSAFLQVMQRLDRRLTAQQKRKVIEFMALLEEVGASTIQR